MPTLIEICFSVWSAMAKVAELTALLQCIIIKNANCFFNNNKITVILQLVPQSDNNASTTSCQVVVGVSLAVSDAYRASCSLRQFLSIHFLQTKQKSQWALQLGDYLRDRKHTVQDSGTR